MLFLQEAALTFFCYQEVDETRPTHGLSNSPANRRTDQTTHIHVESRRRD